MSMHSLSGLTLLALGAGLFGLGACDAEPKSDTIAAAGASGSHEADRASSDATAQPGATGQGGAAGTAADSGAGATRSELSASERAGLTFTREEEKLARDVYISLQGSDRVFENIAASEQTHMDAVATLLERYALPDPAQGKAAGDFTDGTLQSLHERLVREGRASVVAALQVGLEIEELDLRDIEQVSADVTHADVERVYAQLTRGSRNHLRAFYARLSAIGGTYTPKYLDAAAFQAVATSSRETGP